MREIIDFLQNRVMGRTVYTDELVYSLENGALEGVYSDRMSFSNLQWSRAGFQFDLVITNEEVIYEMDGDGNRGQLRQDFSGSALFRYELARRRSTDKLTGIFRFLSATGGDATAGAVASGVYDVHFDGKSLSWQEQQLLYRDQPSTEGGFRSVAFDAKAHLYFDDEKLHFLYDGICYDVNPDTLARTKSLDEFPSFLSKER